MARPGPETLRKRLERALGVAGNTHTPDDVSAAIGRGRMQAWTRGDSLVVTEIMQFPRCNVLNVFLAVGNLDEVLSLIPDLEDFAREHGCKAIRMQGRRGWARVLPSYGWKEDKQVIFERAL